MVPMAGLYSDISLAPWKEMSATWHADVKQQDVRQLLLGDPEGVLGGSALPDHVQHAGAAQGVNHALSKQRMIVYDSDTKPIAHFSP